LGCIYIMGVGSCDRWMKWSKGIILCWEGNWRGLRGSR
jgi:hypothetical protein